MLTAVFIRALGTREKLTARVKDVSPMGTCAKDPGKMANSMAMANYTNNLAAFSKGTSPMEKFRVTVRSASRMGTSTAAT